MMINRAKATFTGCMSPTHQVGHPEPKPGVDIRTAELFLKKNTKNAEALTTINYVIMKSNIYI
jgi:hypothetical protein